MSYTECKHVSRNANSATKGKSEWRFPLLLYSFPPVKDNSVSNKFFSLLYKSSFEKTLIANWGFIYIWLLYDSHLAASKNIPYIINICLLLVKKYIAKGTGAISVHLLQFLVFIFKDQWGKNLFLMSS